MRRILFLIAVVVAVVACRQPTPAMHKAEMAWAQVAYFRVHLYLKQSHANMSQAQMACLSDETAYGEFATVWLAQLSPAERQEMDNFYQSTLGQRLVLASRQAFEIDVLKRPPKDMPIVFDGKAYQAIAVFYQSTAYQKMLTYPPANMSARLNTKQDTNVDMTLIQIANRVAKRCRLIG